MARSTGLNQAAKALFEDKPKVGRPKSENIVRDKGSQKGLTADWTRSTFIVNVAVLDKLKDYAYTERITMKEALDRALTSFLQDKDNLLDHTKGVK